MGGRPGRAPVRKEMSQEEERKRVEEITEKIQDASLQEAGAAKAHGGSNRPAKKEKPVKQAPPPPAEDHAKDRYGRIPINFGRMTHNGTLWVVSCVSL